MQQYQDIKARHPGMILFFRLGDFYEMFGEDAVKASRLLDVVLTHRQNVPMCGVPYHAVSAYLKKLIKVGEKIAICEQLEDPAQARGIVKRDVVRIITPGTVIEDHLLNAKENNFLMAVFPDEKQARFGIACVDVSTGEFTATELPKEKLAAEAARLSPGEIILPLAAAGHPSFPALAPGSTLSTLEDWHFSYAEAQRTLKEYYNAQSLKPFGLEGKALAAAACGGILAYLGKTQAGKLPLLTAIRYYSLEDYMLLDPTATRNLEILEGLNANRENSLLEVVDRTLTPMGSRLMRQWLLQPLLSLPAIVGRQDAVAFLVDEGMARRNVREQTKNVADIQRIVGRMGSGIAGPRELLSLRLSLERLPAIRQCLQSDNPLLSLPSSIQSLKNRFVAPPDITALIARAIADEPPLAVKDGGVIRDGYDPRLDELRTLRRDVKELLSRMEEKERAATGIMSLKIGYTSVFGYYLEVTKANLASVPAHYIRKQTLTNAERFITPELKAFEEKILSAEEKLLRLEEELFKEVRNSVLAFSKELQAIAGAVAELDCYAAFAEIAALNNYCRPVIDDSFVIDIKDGRHPVIETKLKSGAFVSNDVSLDGDEQQILLITGPNMAGKSTYLRQVALITVLAQTGSFVPASSACIGIVDRIFTRIGAGDNLAAGESTFMVEMHETAHILNQHTPRSLIILDEVGRGTSTYDGISIAQAAVEYLARSRTGGRGPKTLFATHYFELTDLEQQLRGIKNYNVAVKEWQDTVVFLHKIVPGAADRSYGIHVAKLAGLPAPVIGRAHQILSGLEKDSRSREREGGHQQLEFVVQATDNAGPSSTSSKIMLELARVDLNALTPLEALTLLDQWKKIAHTDRSSEER